MSSFRKKNADGFWTMGLLVEGMHCPSCVALIENTLKKQESIKEARLNLSTKRLNIIWGGEAALSETWISLIEGMGYRALPFDPETSETMDRREEKFLLRCLAVAGFATGNLMLFSIPLWTSDPMTMGEATRTFFHWVQALIAFPAIAYCGIPFYRSAWRALRDFRTNMDVPISVAVVLTTMMSLFETTVRGVHSYFDSAVMLLFFLLIGRYLETLAKGRARRAAHDLLQTMVGYATRRKQDGELERIPLSELAAGMEILVAVGEKIGADGDVLSGESELETSLITGETLPQAVSPGSRVFAGTVNLGRPLVVTVTHAHEHSLIADIVRLMETAEQSQARYVTLADRLSSWYTPVVHILAAVTFFGWVMIGHASWQTALLYAATVLIITCPCALGLAVPVVQVLASSRLMRAGILLKSGSALERLASVKHAVFDKTGTLTFGKPRLISEPSPLALQLAASLAVHSRHPLSQALVGAYKGELLTLSVEEKQGFGLESEGIRLGRRSWAAPLAEGKDDALELWLSRMGDEPVRFIFSDHLREDAREVVSFFQKEGLQVSLLSGDRESVVQAVATSLGVTHFQGELTPIEKTKHLLSLKKDSGVLMVGDGLNDAPSLSLATVSMSPTSAIDITQNAADIVFQGQKLCPVVTAWKTAVFSQALVKQNFILAILYNLIAIPLAIGGMVTPLIAAIAMSSSSLLVIANAMRLKGRVM